MGNGYKTIALNQIQAGQWKDTLRNHGIEVKLEDLPEQKDENARVDEQLISIKLGMTQISSLEYRKKNTGEMGIVFFHKNPEDIEVIDVIISLLK